MMAQPNIRGSVGSQSTLPADCMDTERLTGSPDAV